ncbi:MAG: hypothetical protein HKM98_09140, partial [Gammaproteobacteria bacterium]|nr:hypothetical protein [Gammaproteobacteria bacterium]
DIDSVEMVLVVDQAGKSRPKDPPKTTPVQITDHTFMQLLFVIQVQDT